MSAPQRAHDEPDVVVAVYEALLRAALDDAAGRPVHALVRPADPSATVALRRAADTAALRGRVDVVADDAAVLGPGSEGSAVHDGGVLVALGPVVREGAQARVRSATYRSMADASGGTTVLEERDGTWHVVDVEGAFRL